MERISDIDKIYSKLEELIKFHKNMGEERLASILDHRMHKVSWTTGTELLEEVYKILHLHLNSSTQIFDDSIRTQIKMVENLIEKFLLNLIQRKESKDHLTKRRINVNLNTKSEVYFG